MYRRHRPGAAQVLLRMAAAALLLSSAIVVPRRAEAAGSPGSAVWTRNGSATPFESDWDGAVFDPATPTASPGELRIMQGAEAPTRDEKIVVGVDTSEQIAVEVWNGTLWQTPAFDPLSTVTDSYWWGFDVAYEPLSGDAVLVYNNGTAGTSGLSYRVWDGSVWTGPFAITTPLAGEPKQLQLAAHPYSDEMVLVVSNDTSQDYALVWDGANWGHPQVLTADGTGNDRTDVYASYEQQSGEALVVFGKGTGDVWFRAWTGTAWTTESSVAGLGSGYARWTTLGADPAGDRIAMGVLTNAADVWLAVWNGSAWTDRTLATATATGVNHPAVAVAFEGTSGEALAVYGDGATTPKYRTWAGAGWSAPLPAPDIGATSNSLMLYPEPAADGVILAVQDAGSGLHDIYWNGSSWGAATPLESDTGDDKNQPFLFLWPGVTGTPPNVPPTAVDDPTSGTISVVEGGSVIIDVLANDTDPDDGIDPSTVVPASGTVGTTSADPTTGAVTYTHDGSETTGDTFTYTVRDLAGALSNSATVTVTVLAQNDPPVLDPITDRTAPEGTPITFTATATDPDLPPNTLTYTLEDGPGTIPPGAAITPDGDFTWTPTEPQGPATWTFDIVVTDGTATDRHTITITVTETNTPPTLDPITDRTAPEGTPITFTATATDPDLPPNTLTYTLEDGPGTIPPGAAITPDGDFTWTPTEPQGPATWTFDIVVTDGTATDRHTITITVTETNTPPTLDPITDRTAPEGTPITFTATATDPDQPPNTLTYTATDLPPGLTIDPTTGTITGTVAAWAAGAAPYAVTVTVDDGHGGTDAASFTWSITKVDDPPAASNDGPFSLAEDTTLQVDATDVEFVDSWGSEGNGAGQFAGLRGVAVGPDGSVFVADTGNHRVQKFDATGTFLLDWGTFGTGPGEFNHPIGIGVSPDGDVYVADLYGDRVERFDPSGAYLGEFGGTGAGDGELDGPRGIAFGPSGEVYVADSNNDRVQVFTRDGTYIRQWGSSGSGAGELLGPRDVAVAPSGTVFVTDAFNDRVQVFDRFGAHLGGWGATGSGTGEFDLPRGIDIDPSGRVWVADSFNDRIQVFSPDGTWSATLGGSGSGDGEFDVTYGLAITSDGVVYAGDLLHRRVQWFSASGILANDADPDRGGDGRVATVASDVAHGSLTLDGDGSFSYTPSPDWYGTDSFIYEICDDGSLCDTALVTLVVTPVNDAPRVTVPAPQTDAEGATVSLPIVLTDVDFGDVHTFTAGGLPSGLAIDPGTGVVSGVVDEGAAAGSPYTVVVRGTDDGSPPLFDDATFTWTITETNTPPTLDPITDRTAPEGTPIAFTATATDPDLPPNTLTYTLEDGPGTIPPGAATTPDGDFTWTPTEPQGPATWTFDIVVTDGTATDRHTLTITVTETNTPPTLDPITDRTAPEGTPTTFTVTATDPDLPPNTLTYTATDLPPGLAIDPTTGTITGTVAYTAAGTYVVTITVDDIAATASTTFAWVITDTNRPPQATPIVDRFTDVGETVTATATATDPDQPAADLVWSRIDGPGTITADGAYTWTPGEADGPGSHAVTLIVTDTGIPPLTASVTFNVTVGSRNRPPVASDDAVTVPAGTRTRFNPLDNDTDPDGDPLRITKFEDPGIGTVAVSDDGEVTYAAPAGFTGEFAMSYTIGDGHGGTATATVTLTIVSTNHPPVGVVDVVSLADYAVYSIPVLANDSDPDGDELSLTSVEGNPTGRVTMGPSGDVIYQPLPGWVGTDVFGYVVSDSLGQTAAVTVAVTITPEVRRAAAAASADLGTAAGAFPAPVTADPFAGSVSVSLTTGVTLLADAFFQSLGALSVPFGLLAVALVAATGFGGSSQIGLLIKARRQRLWSVVLVDRERTLPARRQPDPDAEPIYFYEPTANNIRSVDRPRRTGGVLWLPVDTPNGVGWVERTYLTEDVDLAEFLDDDQAVAVVKDLSQMLDSGRDISRIVAPRGLAVALDNRPRRIPRDHIASAGWFWDEVAHPLRRALDDAAVSAHTQHSRFGLIPVELWNFRYLAIRAPDQTPWLLYFEYIGGKPYLVGIGIDE